MIDSGEGLLVNIQSRMYVGFIARSVSSLQIRKELVTASRNSCRLRVVSNFGDGDCGAGEIHTRARKFQETRREGSAEN